MSLLELTFPSGGPAFDVRRFSVREAVSTPFAVHVSALSPEASLDLRKLVGEPVIFLINAGWAHVQGGGARTWRGICQAIAESKAETTGLSTYEITIAPLLWMCSQRRDKRIFQHMSLPDIVDEVLGAWKVPLVWRVDRGAYPKLEYRVQYGESDLSFVSRLLEEAGIAYTFEEDESGSLALSDALHHNDPRPGPPLPFVDNPNRSGEMEFVTEVGLRREARRGVEELLDHDLRKPDYSLSARAENPLSDPRFVHTSYLPGGSVIEGQRGGDTPVADDQGIARASEPHWNVRATRRMEAARLGERAVVFSTNALDLRPGSIFAMSRHPSAELAEQKLLLVTEATIEGAPGEEWRASYRAVSAEAPFRPALVTEKPRALGLVSAFVVGPSGQEIHADELGRVRVRFPWDRSGKTRDTTSCFLRVSHNWAWAGPGFGVQTLPRVGDEVLVTFFGGDPDEPVILAGAYNGSSVVPHPLPKQATASAVRTATTPGGGGFNEIVLQDRSREEVMGIRAEQDHERLTRYDETITIERDRSSLVEVESWHTTGKDRERATAGKRTRLVGGARRTRVEGKRSRRFVKRLTRTVGKSVFRALGTSQRWVTGEARTQVDKKDSLIVDGERHEVVEDRYAVESASAHLASLDDAVWEGVKSVTLKVPGAYVVIDSMGVTIFGPLVKINSGGEGGSGAGASPDDPKPPSEMPLFDPPMPYEGAMPDGEATRVVAEDAPPSERAPVELSWIEIVLHDGTEQKNPVGGERYRVTTANGKVIEGNLDGRGRARIEGIVPGTCQVTFPNLDQEDWE